MTDGKIHEALTAYVTANSHDASHIAAELRCLSLDILELRTLASRLLAMVERA